MKLFNRNKSDASESIDPADINLPPAPEMMPEYTQPISNNSSSSRFGMHGLAVGAVAGLLLILVGLFFGGRWVYQQINQPSVPSTAVPQKVSKPNTPKNSQLVQTPSGNSAVTPPANSSNVAPTPAVTTPTPTPGATTLTNTGPGSILAVFVIASAIGVGVYELYLRRAKMVS